VRLFDEEVKFMKGLSKFGKRSTALMPEEVCSGAGCEHAQESCATIAMCEDLENAAAAITLGARLGVESPEEIVFGGMTPHRATRVDTGVEGWQTTKEQVDARREEWLLLSALLRASRKSAECQEPVGRAFGFTARAVWEERLGQFREACRVSRCLLKEQF
jgi:hypothetical protein